MAVADTLSKTLIVVDWGTASFRAVLIASDGRRLAELETEDGIQSVVGRSFEEVLLTALGPWLDAHWAAPIVLLGMVTSRNGWIEVPYVPCPCTAEDLARGAVRRRLVNGSMTILLPGITDPGRKPFPDVMRGEETQIVGVGLHCDATLVLPGTHSKWARVEGGRIAGFQTFVTGELFHLLSQHSFIARSAGAGAGADDQAAFERGARTALEGSADHEALLSVMFSARTGLLAGALKPAEIRDYASGLLIGQEFRQAKACGWFEDGARIGIVGNDGLNQRYAAVAQLAGLDVVEGSEHAAVDGARAIVAQLAATL